MELFNELDYIVGKKAVHDYQTRIVYMKHKKRIADIRSLPNNALFFCSVYGIMKEVHFVAKDIDEALDLVTKEIEYLKNTEDEKVF